MEFVEYTGSDLVDAEYTILKTSHAEMGAYLLGLWGIPDSVVVKYWPFITNLQH